MKPRKRAATRGLLAAILLFAPPMRGEELQVHFSTNGTPNQHILNLIWPTADANLLSIAVLDATTKAIVQQIDVPQDGLNLKLQDINNSREKYLESLDYNFDGAPDIRILKDIANKAAPRQYMIFVYRPEMKRYELDAQLSAVPGIVPDRERDLLVSSTLGPRPGEFIRNYHAYGPSGQLSIDERHIQRAVGPGVATDYELDIRKRVQGNLQRVCMISIEREGKRKIKRGSRDTCGSYLKEPDR